VDEPLTATDQRILNTVFANPPESVNAHTLITYRQDMQTIGRIVWSRGGSLFSLTLEEIYDLRDNVAYGAESTRRRRIQALRTVCHRAKDLGLIERDPTDALRMKRGPSTDYAKKEREGVTGGELARMLVVAEGQDARLGISVLGFMGLKRHEVLALRGRDFNTRDSTLHLPRDRYGEARVLHMPWPLRQLIEDLRRDDKLPDNVYAVFVRANQHTREDALNRAVRDAAEKAGITRQITPETFRGGFHKRLVEYERLVSSLPGAGEPPNGRTPKTDGQSTGSEPHGQATDDDERWSPEQSTRGSEDSSAVR